MSATDSIHRIRELRRRLSPTQKAALETRLRGCSQQRFTPTIARSARHEAPLSFAQQRLWFLEQLEPGRALYNLPQALRLIGPLDVPAFQKALTRIVERHEVLRTRFATRGGEPVQIISPPQAVQVPISDLQNVASDTCELELQRYLLAAAQRPFDLQHDLMLRANLFRLGPAEHVLLITMHHIAADAWSIGLLFEELTVLYNGFVRGRAERLPELPMQYADYAIWRRERMQGEMLDKQLSYWKEQLRDAPPFLDLPIDRPRSSRGNSGATRSILLPTNLTRVLSDLAREEGATLFITLLAAFQTLLHRYTAQDDIAVGSPILGRNRRETERLIGCFLNTVVLRTDCSGAPTFRDFLRRLRTTALAAYAHQELPFEKLVEELQPARDANRTPFFQVMFTLQNAPAATLALHGLEAQAIDLDLGVAPFDLTLLMEQRPDGLKAYMEYKTDLFEAPTIDRMLRHFQSLLAAIAGDPQQRITHLPIVPSAEREMLLAFNQTSAEFPQHQTIHELFEQQAARTPEATAVRFGEGHLTYRELNERANQLSHYLRKLGVGREMFVGICVKRSLDAIVALFGVLKAGAAYVSLDPDHPKDRLALILRDAAIRVVLTHESLVKLFPAADDPDSPILVRMDREWPAREHRENPGVTPKSNDVAYVIYTSGSTGVPKGVLIEHRAVVNHAVGFAKRFGLNADDRVLQFAPLTFDVSGEEIFPTLLSGGTVTLRPGDVATSIAGFHSFLVRERLTILNLPTPYWDEWMHEMEIHALPLPPSLRLVVVGSDTVTPEQYARWRKLAGRRVRWCNAYGSTEATISSTIYEPQLDEIPSVVPIGRPVANVQVYILDPHQQLTPIGVPGELHIGGEGVARGYLNDRTSTGQKFVPNPFDARPGARLLRTGDRARWRADGNLEFLGRIDHQVKIRGFRIEVGEIESVLRQHALVKDAAVVAQQDSSGEKRVVAYVVPNAPTPHLVTTLLRFLRRKLPAYMVPAAFVSLERLPLLPSGKVNRKALPAPAGDRPELSQGFVAPGDALEENLAAIWRRVLGFENIGVHDNFFDLGGHSLLAVRLVAEIEKWVGRNLPVATLFQSPTIRQLAEVLRNDAPAASRAVIVPLQPHGSKPPLFLVHGAGGGMLWGYANLARHLGTDQPVYCFNSPGMDGLEELPRIDDMAAHYVEALRQFQPNGPYVLGGYCFGGEVAFEMAQQLSAQGHRVTSLIMFNAMPPNSSFEKLRFTPAFGARFLCNSIRWFRYFCQWTPAQRCTFLKRKLRLVKKALARRLGRGDDASSDETVEDWIDVSLYPEHQLRLWDSHLRASAVYHPQPYPGHITVFRTRIFPFLCSFDPSLGWREFARGGVTAKVAPGTHESILDEPHVGHLARELEQMLRRQLQRASTAGIVPLLNLLSLAATCSGAT